MIVLFIYFWPFHSTWVPGDLFWVFLPWCHNDAVVMVIIWWYWDMGRPLGLVCCLQLTKSLVKCELMFRQHYHKLGSRWFLLEMILPHCVCQLWYVLCTERADWYYGFLFYTKLLIIIDIFKWSEKGLYKTTFYWK